MFNLKCGSNLSKPPDALLDNQQDSNKNCEEKDGITEEICEKVNLVGKVSFNDHKIIEWDAECVENLEENYIISHYSIEEEIKSPDEESM